MKKVLILSGAGLSAESGLKTFRDSNGLWEEYNVMEVCSVEGFAKNPKKVLSFYDKRREQLAACEPNLAHKMISSIKNEFPQNIVVFTQNVDDLLERANCSDIIHLHGFLPELRCWQCDCIFNIGYESIDGKICPKCESIDLRHNIVMFGESAPMYKILYNELMICDMFVCIGTSGEVLDVASFAKKVKFSILNNLESSHLDKFFTKCYIETASLASKNIEEDIRKFLQ